MSIPKLEAELARNEAEFGAAQAEGRTFPPPTDDNLRTVSGPVTTLDSAITSATVPKAVLGAAGTILGPVAEARSRAGVPEGGA